MFPSRSALTGVVTLVLGACLAAGATDAVAPPQQPSPRIDRLSEDGWLRSPEAARVEAALQRSPEWIAWSRLHPGWRATWNPRTRTPHRAYGPGVRLDGFAPLSSANIEAACRDFLGRTADLTGIRPADLQLLRAEQRLGRWYVVLGQTVDGVPVRGGRVDLRLGADGEVVLFGADWHRDIAVSRRPSVSGGAALAAATSGLASPAEQVESRLVVAPQASAGGYVYHLAHELRFRTAEPLGRWTALVDAHTGQLLWRDNEIRYAELLGSLTAEIEPITQGDVPETLPLRDTRVEVDPGPSEFGYTNAAGDFQFTTTSSDSVNVLMRLAGLYGKVYNEPQGYSTPELRARLLPGSPRTLAWDDSNSLASERDAYFHALVGHQFIKELDPAFTGLDYQMPIVVDIDDGDCNAYYDGYGINFYGESGRCASTARVADVVLHEYGHGITDWQYRPLSPSAAMHEAFSDYLATTITDQPLVGRGMRGPGTIIRSVDNTLRAPDDLTGEPHHDGLILGGALWDLRQALGVGAADSLFHYARYGLSDRYDDYLLDVLFTDDDNADIYDGTPRFDVIIATFMAHGIGDYDVHIAHLEEPDTEDLLKPLELEAQILSVFVLDPASLLLHWNADGGAWNTLALAPTGSGPRVFAASLPPQPDGTTVGYYFTAADSAGHSAVEPPGGADAPYQFHIGADVVPPSLEHEPLADRPLDATDWTVRVHASDNLDRGLHRVFVDHSRNEPGLGQQFDLVPVGDGSWEGNLPLAGASLGDVVHYRVTALDSATIPNSSVVPGSGSLSFQVVRGRRDNLEAGAGGLAGDGDWQWGEVHAGPGRGWSGTHAWGTGLVDVYTNDSQSRLTTAPIDLTGWSRGSLVFRHWLKSEPVYDGGVVEISDDGTTWFRLDPSRGYPQDYVVGLDSPGYSGDSDGWQPAEFDLSLWLGRSVQLRWRFGSDAGIVGPGWFVDDIEIVERQVRSVPLALQAESGLDSRVPLVWSPPAGIDPLQPGTPLQGYHVYRATTPDPAAATRLTMSPLTDAAFVDETAVNGTLYWYAVSALYAEGESEWSSPATGLPFVAGYAADPPSLLVQAPDGAPTESSVTFTNTGTGFLEVDLWLGDAGDTSLDDVRIAYDVTTPPAPAAAGGVTSTAAGTWRRADVLRRLAERADKRPLHATRAAPAAPQGDFQLLYTDPEEGGTTPDLQNLLVQETAGLIVFQVTGYAPWGSLVSDFNMLIGIDVDASRATGDEDGSDLYVIVGAFPMSQFGTPGIVTLGQQLILGVPAHLSIPNDADVMEVGISTAFLGGAPRVRLAVAALNAAMQATIDVMPNPRAALAWMQPGAWHLTVPAGQPAPLAIAFPGTVPDGIYNGKILAETNAPATPAATIGVTYTHGETPVELYDFTAVQEDDAVVLRWRTRSESDVTAFRVFRARAGGPFEALAPDLEPRSERRYTFRDPSATPGRWVYRVGEVDGRGAVVLHGHAEVEVAASVPLRTALDPAVPNPFNPTTTLRFGSTRPGPVRLAIHDVRGRLVRTLVQATLPAGWHRATWNGRDDRGRLAASGVYHARLTADGHEMTQRLILVK